MFGYVLDRTIKRRTPGSHIVYAAARRVISAYENHDVQMWTNGEHWLQERVAARGPVTAIDVGANSGEWTTGLLCRTRDCRIYSYEPAPETFARLERNVTDARASLFNKALSSSSGRLQMHFAADSPDVSSVENVAYWKPGAAVRRIHVEASTGDDEASRLECKHITMLKVDAEGHDYDVLCGFSRLLAENAIDFIQFEYNTFTMLAKRCLRDFFDLLSERFLICRLLPEGLEASGYHVAADDFRQSNWVAVRKALVDARLVKDFRIRPVRGLTASDLKLRLENEPTLRNALGWR